MGQIITLLALKLWWMGLVSMSNGWFAAWESFQQNDWTASYTMKE